MYKYRFMSGVIELLTVNGRDVTTTSTPEHDGDAGGPTDWIGEWSGVVHITLIQMTTNRENTKRSSSLIIAYAVNYMLIRVFFAVKS